MKLDRLVAVDARHRRLTGDIALGEAIDHRLLEAGLVIEHVVRDADAFGHLAGIVDVLPGAAGAFAVGRRAMVVKLEGDADDVVAFRLEQRRRHRRIDAARHGNDDARVRRTAVEIKAGAHPFIIRFGWSDATPAGVAHEVDDEPPDHPAPAVPAGRPATAAERAGAGARRSHLTV